ncbi:hypothetical protein K431DRAFT_282958 [Polychaeton citri CBS 116435]|uniref:Uncharacterized protein n=1 Tax=Polychaeton citri CBS 116435 TaxID=1314669 RepID=A0A9P4QAA5_9PEZI|nr:hypothetical protein K431DRAFT_282958 [Polychaeton citri CBS 116435]
MAVNFQILPPDTPVNVPLPSNVPPRANQTATTSVNDETEDPRGAAIQAARQGIENFPGPVINGKSTQITLYFPPSTLAVKAPQQLTNLYHVINEAFTISHRSTNSIPASVPRLYSEQQLVQELEAASAGTFCYVIYHPDTQEVVGTASAEPYRGPATNADRVAAGGKKVFLSAIPLEDGVEMWELRLMAVDVKVQKQGVAGLLMRLVEERVKAVFVEKVTGSNGSGGPQRLKMVLKTIKEINGLFYNKKMYALELASWNAPGTLNSEVGFTLAHMSKDITP